MSSSRMHPDEIETDAALVARLIAAQFPQWAALPIARVRSSGTDNAIYRLGDEMAVRLPRVQWAAGQATREHEWLPRLAPHLPLAIPRPLALGQPGVGYPWPWAVVQWLDGEDAASAPVADLRQAALDLAAFVAALQRIDSTGGPPPPFGRGQPLATRDAPVRAALATLDGMIDVAAATAAWEMALRVPPWQGAPVWLHGDLQPTNLLVRDGRLSAVIDFGCLGVGDPAGELIVAWNFLAGQARDHFRAALGVDGATWARGRGWALSVALIALPYYHQTNPEIARASRRTIAEVLAAQPGAG